MKPLQQADDGLEQLDGLQIHDVTITRGEVGSSSAYIARCSGCVWAMVGPQRSICFVAAQHERTGE